MRYVMCESADGATRRSDREHGAPVISASSSCGAVQISIRSEDQTCVDIVTIGTIERCKGCERAIRFHFEDRAMAIRAPALGHPVKTPVTC